METKMKKLKIWLWKRRYARHLHKRTSESFKKCFKCADMHLAYTNNDLTYSPKQAADDEVILWRKGLASNLTNKGTKK
jgi:hypothetical protein